MSIVEILIVMEIIIVNMLTLSRCCHMKYNKVVVLGVMSIFTAVCIGLGYILVSRLEYYGNGNGFFVIFGFLYLIPLGSLYKESRAELFLVICMAWVYTLGVFALAVQIGKLLGGSNFLRDVLMIETVLFLLGTKLFNKMMVDKYIYILESFRSQKQSWDESLASTSIMYFFTMLCINYVFAMEEGAFLKVLSILLLLFSTFLTYYMLYNMDRHKNEMKKLDKTAHYDELTGLRNRLSLFIDLEKLLKSDEVFTVLFMDLDKFKDINDKYGHLAGDKYLRHFAEIISDIVGERGSVYRFGGDEFVAMCAGTVSPGMISQLQEMKDWEKNAPCPFNHVSIGIQECRPTHMDVEELLERVDKSMYKEKRE